ncbi:protein-export chaperone SecB [Anaplasma phagocytophilum]|uniref:Protein-export protein SecB n=9 Tax=Anaplasma phagocytophilum TaxID=948 RepID=SECB_ANAPZ|nr:protein-export chaperone SecB [Anaplasma phagocytophilum]Q2GLM6.1 RecName: Full=Protein-export protein SecB [Anaplasma phagocytophilum str. HZ]KJV64613.1 protein-export chaperone SecB [Anaplasma phagocytophilum str. ApMUC09]KJV66308.1 protein-export chaperone SecB [Anaplasma phagocytophilum str. ApNP]ABD43515.1 protein-export protein SecB [Anaplasma phagocytophilum str. HZ]AGR78600.1 preprotein translocase subunit SecB [Anaplasma phagocytophilum str. HZ2]AGR79847.1 preprotein translocase s
MQPKIRVRGQYIKDLSFENPNAPKVFLMMSKTPPEINISVNVSSAALPVKPPEGEQASVALYEVALQINIESVVEKLPAFICEIKYCGVFSIEEDEELEQEQVKRALLINAPSILFPFVREVIAKVTSSAGFPPLMLEVIDFSAMYEKQLAENADGEK